MLLHQITDKILKAFYSVYNDLGYGFLESVISVCYCKAERVE